MNVKTKYQKCNSLQKVPRAEKCESSQSYREYINDEWVHTRKKAEEQNII